MMQIPNKTKNPIQIPKLPNSVAIYLREQKVEPIDCDIITAVYDMLMQITPMTRLPRPEFSPKMLPSIFIATVTDSGVELFSLSLFNVGKWNPKGGYWHPIVHYSLIATLEKYVKMCK